MVSVVSAFASQFAPLIAAQAAISASTQAAFKVQNLNQANQALANQVTPTQNPVETVFTQQLEKDLQRRSLMNQIHYQVAMAMAQQNLKRQKEQVAQQERLQFAGKASL